MINNIVFFCPSRITGGQEYLFIRLAEYLLESQDEYTIYYCDYPDGFSHSRCLSDKVHYIDYKDKDTPIAIPENSIVLVQLNIISQPERFVMEWKNSILIYWMLHSLNIKDQIYKAGHYWISKRERRCLGEELRILTEMGVIKCMAYGSYATLVKDFFQKPQVFSWLPNIVPSLANTTIPDFCRLSDDCIKFCWLGRINDEKALNILTYMNELEEISKTYKISLALIGKGPAEEKLKKIVGSYSYPISFLGEKHGMELDGYLRKETEIGLASGTSALEFSLRGKPVIMEWVIDKVYSAGVRDKYIFTHENEQYDYCSGNELKRLGENFFSFKLKEILNNYSGISKQEYEYATKMTPANCASILVDSISQIEERDFKEIELHVRRASSLIQKGRNRILLVHNIINMLRFNYK